MALSLPTRVAFDALIVTVAAPDLKGRGYRKHGLRWTRTRDKVKAGIRVQREPRARWLDEICFTFTFDVRTADVVLLGRIGALMPEPGDVWWHVRAGVLRRKTVLAELEPQLVEHEIADAVCRVADAIDALTTTADVRAFAGMEPALVKLGLLRITELR